MIVVVRSSREVGDGLSAGCCGAAQARAADSDEVASVLFHVSGRPGAVAVVRLALIEAETDAGAATVTVWLIVLAVAPAESTAFAVKVTVVGPASDVVLEESPSVPLPPPAKANGAPAFHTLTWVRLPSGSWP